MLHIPEGELHAYLDGALEFYPAEDAGRIRRHLDVCEECRVRLGTVEGLLARSRVLIARASPGEIVPPPLEVLLRRAELDGRSESPPRLSRRVLGAWAATVVIALGLGWAAAGFGFRPGGSSRVVLDGDVPPAALAAAGNPVDQPEGDVARSEPALGAVEDEAPPSLLDAPPTPARVVVAAPAPGGVLLPFAQTPAVEMTTLSALSATPPPLPSTLDAWVGTSALGLSAVEAAQPEPSATSSGFVIAGSSGLSRRSPATASAPSPLVARARSGGLGTGIDLRQSFPTESRPTSIPERSAVPASVPETPTAPLLIPGLEVVSVEWTEVTPGMQGVRVTQRTGDGVALDLRFLGVRVGGAPDPDVSLPLPASVLGERLPEGWNQVALPFHGGWVLLRGPLSETRLRSFLVAAGVGGTL